MVGALCRTHANRCAVIAEERVAQLVQAIRHAESILYDSSWDAPDTECELSNGTYIYTSLRLIDILRALNTIKLVLLRQKSRALSHILKARLPAKMKPTSGLNHGWSLHPRLSGEGSLSILQKTKLFARS